MKFYLCSAVTVSAYTSVEADSLQEAIQLAKDRDVVIGGIGSGADENESWIIEEPDGTPNEIHEA